MDTNGMLTVTEVAAILRVSRNFIYKLIKTDELKAVDISTGPTKPIYRIEEDELEAFKERNKA